MMYYFNVDRCLTFTRSDGIEHRLVPIPRCKCCFKPIKPMFVHSGLCWDCSRGSPFSEGLDRTIAATLYVPGVSLDVFQYGHNQEIYELKNNGRHAAAFAEVLAFEMTVEKIRTDDRTVICPIPMRSPGEGSVGAKELSMALASRLNKRHAEILKFTREIPSQKSMGAPINRQNNVHLSMASQYRLEGRQIILVDDVTATGYTLAEGARALKAEGAGEVIGVVAARDVSFYHLEHVGVIIRDGE